MVIRGPLAVMAVTVPLLASAGLAAGPQVRNVRTRQLADKTVEVLYDLAGAWAGGATVSVRLSQDGGASYTITPAASALSGQVGTGVTNGRDRRIVWNASATMPAEFYSSNMRAAVTAVDPGGGGHEITVTLPGSVPLVLVEIPHGTFMMGTPASQRGRVSDELQHEVTLRQDYYIGKYEVTQRQWVAVMGTNPAYPPFGVGDDYPVFNVSWNDICGGTTGSSCAAGSFIGKLNSYLGTTTFRLPTEAEWEYAARAGTTKPFSFPTPSTWDTACGSFPEAEPFMWWCINSGFKTHLVGLKQENPWGLHDIHGNVWEWVSDWYGSYPSGAVMDPAGPSSGSNRVVRGGSWNDFARYCRSATRHSIGPGDRGGSFGFRLARSQ